ncbi:DNA polymerase III subunit alpha [Microlunatus ginsengisoli]|uniref:DNA-directed DNA polymerase n=1 Tax=Microlunatus ginsengisoli TaxID=363863 RepID=A0ABP7ALT2_9ACTN
MTSPSPETGGFVHLHTHTEFSLLDGMGRVGDMVAAAKAAGQTALAITDHGTLGGAWKFAHACRAAGVKPILGMEAYLGIGSRFDPQVLQVPRDGADVDATDVDGADPANRDAGTKRKSNEHLTVLAATPTGWTNLVKINNAAQQTFRGRPLADVELLARHGAGLIVLTGCLGGPVAGPLARGEDDLAERNLLGLIGAVGAGNVFVEVMDHGIESESRVLAPLARLADAHGLTIVATNDAHYVREVDAPTHDVWLASQSKSTLTSEKRFRFNGSGYHLRTEAEMRALRPTSRRWQDAVSATATVAAMVEDWVLPEVRYRLPAFTLPEGFDSPAAYLHRLALDGARSRYGTPLPAQVRSRLRREEDVIRSTGFSVYFLILAELVAWARDHGILVGPGRGSACGSALAYSLGITDVEPIGANLLFERFLEAGRTDMPDIDVDFEQRRIPEIHAHLRELYGADCVARLGTFAMARSRRAVKDVARVLGRPDLGTRLADLVPVDQGKPVGLDSLEDESFAAGEEFRTFVGAEPGARRIVDHARTVENAVLGAGIHACGVIVSGEPLTDLVPLRKDRQGPNKDLPPDRQPWVTDWDGKDTEALGLLKLDALFLRSLDVLAETSRIIAETTGEHVDFARLPDTADTSDPRVRRAWELLCEGRTSSVFQMEGAGMRELLVGAAPASLEDLSAISALYRPGPLAAGMAERYVERRNGREPVDYGIYTDDPAEQEWLATVLDTTSGVCIASGEMVHSVTRGRQVPIEQIVVGELVQSVASDLSAQPGRVTRVMERGEKAIVHLITHSGDTIRLTADHRVLTQDGWKPAAALTASDSVAAPWKLNSLAQAPATQAELHEARILGCLLADGGVTRLTSAFFTKDRDELHDALDESLRARFPNARLVDAGRGPHQTRASRLAPIIGIRGGIGGTAAPEHLRWMRSVGLKTAKGADVQRGPASHEKRIPTSWTGRSDEALAALLAALWDCDGHIGHGRDQRRNLTIRYTTVSPGLAYDVRHCLLRLGIASTVTRSPYNTASGSDRVQQSVLVADPESFAAVVGPHMRHTGKRNQLALRTVAQAISRSCRCPRRNLKQFADRHRPWKTTLRTWGVPNPLSGVSQTVGYGVLSTLAEVSGDLGMQSLTKVRWLRVKSVEDAGASPVFDLEVAEHHSFVAQNLLVHNCAFQEQSMLLGTVVAGFDAAGRARLRRAIGKKKADLMAEVGTAFLDGAVREFRDPDGNVISPVFSRATAERLWDMLKGSASYQFNKCLTGDTVLPSGGAGGWTIGDLYARIESCTSGPSPDGLCRYDGNPALPTTGRCKTCQLWWGKFRGRGLTVLAYDFADDRIRPKRVRTVHYNGIRPVTRVVLSDGRSVRATGNHRFLTPSGWRRVHELRPGDALVVDGGYERLAHDPTAVRTTVGDRRGVGPVSAQAEGNVGHVDGDDRPDRRRPRWQKGHVPATARIVAITPAGVEPTYDVEMDDENHSFVANGIVSHNSHSYAYGQVTFLTAYAKANWPAQCAAAVLACTDDDEKRRRVLLDLAADGIEVAPPDVNQGRATTSVGADGRLRLGLSEIRDVGRAADLIIAERDTGGPFTSLADLTARMAGRGVSAKVFEAVIEAGALDAFGPRLGMLMVLRADLPLRPVDAEWAGLERSERQRMRLGVRVGPHPLVPHRDALRRWRSDDGEHAETGTPLGRPAIGVTRLHAADIPDRGRPVLVAGLLTRWEETTTRNGTMARFDLEGSDGAWVEGVMWNRDLAAQRTVGVPALGSAVAVDGFAKRRTVQVRVTDPDGSDPEGSYPDGRDDTDADRFRTVEALRLRADLLHPIRLPEQGRLELPPARRRIDLRAACRAGRELLAAGRSARGRAARAANPGPAGTAAVPTGGSDPVGPTPADPTPTDPTASDLAATGCATPPPARPLRLAATGRPWLEPTAAQQAESPDLPDHVPPPTLPARLPGLSGPSGDADAVRWVLVDTGGLRGLRLANSTDGLLDEAAVEAMRSRYRVLARMAAEARAEKGTVLRYVTENRSELYVTAIRASDLPPDWQRTVFDAVDGLDFGRTTVIDRQAIACSTTPLTVPPAGGADERPVAGQVASGDTGSVRAAPGRAAGGVGRRDTVSA